MDINVNLDENDFRCINTFSLDLNDEKVSFRIVCTLECFNKNIFFPSKSSKRIIQSKFFRHFTRVTSQLSMTCID